MAKRIFMMDDDPLAVEMVGTALQEQGLEFLSALKTEGTLEAIQRYQPDVILLDVLLPDGDGYTVCRKIKENTVLAKIPVIFLTAKGDVASRIQGFSSGGLDYVAKPFALGELLARVHAHIANKDFSDALRHKVDELTMLARVRQDMLDMILHDLRAPLNTVKITLQMVHESGLIQDLNYLRFLQQADAATEIAIFLVNDLLDLRAGELQVKLERVDLKDLVQKVQALLMPRFRYMGLTFRSEIPEEASQTLTDPTLLFRVLLNLHSNAAKFSPEGKEVVVQAKRNDGWLRIEIHDEGPGIPDLEKEKIFQMHYRSETPVLRMVPGYGIGLAFCQLACKSLGGRIWVENGAQGGSRFIIEIPA